MRNNRPPTRSEAEMLALFVTGVGLFLLVAIIVLITSNGGIS